jgi:PAS domain S-box-containing protein
MDAPADSFRLLVESVQDYAIYLLATDGTIQSWNAGAQRLKGYTATEIIGSNFARFFSSEDARAGKPTQLLQRALDDGRVEDIGWRFRKDGSQFWASAVITTLRDASGAHVGFATVTRDLTDRVDRRTDRRSQRGLADVARSDRPERSRFSQRSCMGSDPSRRRRACRGDLDSGARFCDALSRRVPASPRDR